MKKVLLIDSGSGGVNILKECVKVCPHCDYLMFCDTANLPYGDKTKGELEKITIQNLQNIRKFFEFEIVILACNTLSCTALEKCRKQFSDVIFIGTVPAIKPALEKFDESEILVLGTKATIRHNILINSHPNLMKKSPNELASKIDENLDNLDVLKDVIKGEVTSFTPKAIVLGCTHYFSCREIFQEIFPDAEIFDSANGVARRLLSFIEKQEKNCQVQFMTSGEGDMLGKLCWYYFNS